MQTGSVAEPSKTAGAAPGSRGPGLARRSLLQAGMGLGASAGLPLLAPPRAWAAMRGDRVERGGDPALADWRGFKARFVAPEGRVVDTANNGVSHSEGQGIGMLAAAHFGDRDTFDALAGWTTEHLTRGTDRLYAWRYKPGAPVPVDDPNNATDGDMLIAWAMFEAARKWDSAIYRNVAFGIADNIRQALVQPVNGRMVLMPGTYGFLHADHVVVNPSYYVFPALHRFATDMPHPDWARLWQDGVALMRDARYGNWNLPADWVALPGSGQPRIAEGWPARFSWDAVRVPLYMSWVGLAQEPAVASAVAFWDRYSATTAPAWTDLQDDAVAPYAQNCGLRAVRRFATAAHHGHDDGQAPSAADAPDYYAAALTLLVHIARATRDEFATPVV